MQNIIKCLLAVHAGIRNTGSSLPHGWRGVALYGAGGSGNGSERGVLDSGEWGTARRCVSGVGWDGHLVAHAGLLGSSLHVDGDHRVAAGSAEGERPHCNACCRCLGAGCIVGRGMVLGL